MSVNNAALTLYWCFPSLMNLHGERGSVMALEHWASHLGVELRVKRIDAPHELPSLEDADLLFFGPCEIREARILAHQLKNRAQEFREVCAAGVPLLAVGAAGALFARQTQCLQQEESFEGLSVFPMVCKEREKVYGDDIWADAIVPSTGIAPSHRRESLEILGCQIQTIDSYLDDPDCAYARVVYGRGNNGGGDEGCRVKNAVFTNTLGPFLVKNPHCTVSVLMGAMATQERRRGIYGKCQGIREAYTALLAANAFAYEDASAQLIKKYIHEKISANKK